MRTRSVSTPSSGDFGNPGVGRRGLESVRGTRRTHPPTGAALVAEFALSFGPLTGITAERIGYGLGTRENKTRPNVLRAILRDPVAGGAGRLDWEVDTVTILETNVDDANPEWLGHVAERAMAAGALDVYQAGIQMKKGRSGILFTLLCAPADADRFTEMLLRETTAFGVRRSQMERRKLRRESGDGHNSLWRCAREAGPAERRGGAGESEFEPCRQLAERAGVPVKAVYAAALKLLQL